MDKKAVSLYELLEQVKSAFRKTLPFSYWIVAEISELKVNYSGHCYLELIEKEETGETIRAKARATIWASVFRMLQPYFESVTRTRLAAGMKVMIKVTAEFHELYGFSLNVSDIEPSFTIGELARQKLEVISRLKSEGVFDMNRDLVFPEIPRRIAVISSKTAAGFGDFKDQLLKNPFSYRFSIRLFPAVMQGEEAEQSIISAMDSIYANENSFDITVMIRGGGSQSDLNCFNSYLLCSNICQFPLPVLTGIGHEQDETIADLVAHTRLKTPTAVAEYLIDCFREVDEAINERSVSLNDLVTQRVADEKEKLDRMLLKLRPAVKEILTDRNRNLQLLGVNLKNHVRQHLLKESQTTGSRKVSLNNVTREFMNNHKHRLDLLERKKNYLDPFLILKRGYSITYHNGKALKNPDLVSSDEILETRLAEGNLKSKTI
ncbi:MAG: exodeoxyribonuclease VII large subunit [Bacteroidales bacterium]